MAGVYCYVPRDRVTDIVQCGLMVSEWKDRDLLLPGALTPRGVVPMLLNPADDRLHATDPDWQCLRAEVDPLLCWVGDADLYRMARHSPEWMSCYAGSMIRLAEYRFGTFRQPECLVTSSILPGGLVAIGDVLDIPVLYADSETLYLGNLLEDMTENHPDGQLALLFAYCQLQTEEGHMTRTDAPGIGLAVFRAVDGRHWTFRIPQRTECML